jgi:hypothetical protein
MISNCKIKREEVAHLEHALHVALPVLVIHPSRARGRWAPLRRLGVPAAERNGVRAAAQGQLRVSIIVRRRSRSARLFSRRSREVARHATPARNTPAPLRPPRDAITIRMIPAQHTDAARVIRGKVGSGRVGEALWMKLHLDGGEGVADELISRHARGQVRDVQIGVE